MTDATLTEKGQRMEATALLRNVRGQLIAQHEITPINSPESLALAYVLTEAGHQLRKLNS